MNLMYKGRDNLFWHLGLNSTTEHIWAKRTAYYLLLLLLLLLYIKDVTDGKVSCKYVIYINFLIIVLLTHIYIL
ncbi:MAG: hypothetical protein N7Q72_03955, partial [Spiroplasma sp. Tabriz.8]|nr:hypothetical protein [Spiroplasma sp. Tabriz.8]